MPSNTLPHISPKWRDFGFTLIELLIAISIIAVVFGVIISSSQGVQRSSRDSQRQTDLRNIQTALQHYYADQSFYPDGTFVLATATTVTNCSGNPNTPCTANKTYLNSVPKDPFNSGQSIYVYRPLPASCDNLVGSTNKCFNYCIFSKLEITPLAPAGCSSPPSGANFWVTQP